MSKEIKIYGLVCPIELRIVYVGKTNNSLKKRLSQHLYIRERDKSPKKEWILKLKGQLKTPDIVLLEICGLKDWKEIEQKWIFHYYLNTIENKTKKKCVLIAIKCFFVNIAKQPKKVKYIQYEY